MFQLINSGTTKSVEYSTDSTYCSVLGGLFNYCRTDSDTEGDWGWMDQTYALSKVDCSTQTSLEEGFERSHRKAKGRTYRFTRR